jgi:hypothetical protein
MVTSPPPKKKFEAGILGERGRLWWEILKNREGNGKRKTDSTTGQYLQREKTETKRLK